MSGRLRDLLYGVTLFLDLFMDGEDTASGGDTRRTMPSSMAYKMFRIIPHILCQEIINHFTNICIVI